MKNSIVSLIDNEIQPILDELEVERKSILKTGRKVKLIFLPLILLGAAYASFEAFGWADTQLEGIILSSIIVALALILYFTTRSYHFVNQKRKNHFKNNFKKQIVKKVIDGFDTELVYKPIFKTNKKQLDRSQLFKKITEYKEDDAIFGYVDEIEFKMSELHAMNGLSFIFEGIFVQLILPFSSDEVKQEEHKIQKIFEEFKTHSNSKIEISYVKKEIFFGISVNKRLFDIKYNKSNEQEIKENIKLLISVYDLIISIIKAVKKEKHLQL